MLLKADEQFLWKRELLNFGIQLHIRTDSKRLYCNDSSHFMGSEIQNDESLTFNRFRPAHQPNGGPGVGSNGQGQYPEKVFESGDRASEDRAKTDVVHNAGRERLERV